MTKCAAGHSVLTANGMLTLALKMTSGQPSGERGQMAYIVTHGTIPTAIDSGPGLSIDLQQALAHACRMLSEARPNVAIQDGHGRSISGADWWRAAKVRRG